MEMHLGFMDLWGTDHEKCQISSTVLWSIKWRCFIIGPSWLYKVSHRHHLETSCILLGQTAPVQHGKEGPGEPHRVYKTSPSLCFLIAYVFDNKRSSSKFHCSGFYQGLHYIGTVNWVIDHSCVWSQMLGCRCHMTQISHPKTWLVFLA